MLSVERRSGGKEAGLHLSKMEEEVILSAFSGLLSLLSHALVLSLELQTWICRSSARQAGKKLGLICVLKRAGNYSLSFFHSTNSD